MSADKSWAEMTPAEREAIGRQARVGMRALVDEATGFQEERPARDLRDEYEALGGDAADFTAPDFPPVSS